MHILVTGATGLLGNNIVRQLLSDGHKVRVLVRSGCDPRPMQGLDVETVVGNLDNSDLISQAMESVDCVIHSAAIVHVGWKKLAESRMVNVEGTRIIAQIAKQAGVRLVYISTVDTLGVGKGKNLLDEDSPRGEKIQCTYVVSKTESEQVVDSLVKEGLDAIVIHPGFMLGPWDWKPSSGQMLLEVAQRWTPFAPTGGCCVADVRDVARGTISAMQSGVSGRHYILGGENISYWKLWEIMSEVTGSGKPFLPFGPIMRVTVGSVTTIKTKLTGSEGILNSAAMQMGKQAHYYKSDRAKTELGYSARPLSESIADAWGWFQENGYVK